MLLDRIKEKLLGRDDRTRKVSRNIAVSLLTKVLGLVVSLWMVPMTLGYLSKEEYGIWLTISSIVYWFAFLDVGLSNGMRNYMAQAVSTGDYPLARRYFSTTLLLLTLIFSVAFAVVLLVLPWLDMNVLFSTSVLSDGALKLATVSAIGLTLVSFVVKNIGYVYVVHQQYSVMDVLNLLGHALGLAVIFLLTLFTEGSLFYLVVALTSLPVIVYVLSSVPTFARYPQLLPSWRMVDFSLRGRIVGTGLRFFVIQITSCLVIFGSINVFLSHYCTPEAVTVYQISFRLFNLLIIAYTAFISPLWNGYTDASVKGDWEWIRKSYVRSLKVWGLVSLGGVLLLAVSGILFHVWLGDRVEIPFTVSLCTLVYVSLFNLNNCATYLINGLNVIRVQICTSVIATVAFVAVMWLFGQRLGIEGIVLCAAGSYLLMSAVHLYQCHLIVERKATGIWNQ